MQSESGSSFSLNYARTGQSHLLVSLDLVVVKHMGKKGERLHIINSLKFTWLRWHLST